MGDVTQSVELGEGAKRIFLFDEVYPFRAAEEQANRKKLNAFGLLAKLNPLNRPKDETVKLARQEMRLEPFWQIAAQRSIDYTCQLTYPVPVHNAHAQGVEVDGKRYEVSRQSDSKARIEFHVVEHCHRKIAYASFVDGLKRDTIKQSTFENYIAKYKYTAVDVLDRSEVVKPLIPLAAAGQLATAKLNAEAVNAHDIQSDTITFSRMHLYLRPVFAFEFVWSSADKSGVIEVDGLTGEVIENGQWFKDKWSQLTTREMLFDLGADVAGSLVPGGGIAVKVIGRLTE